MKSFLFNATLIASFSLLFGVACDPEDKKYETFTFSGTAQFEDGQKLDPQDLNVEIVLEGNNFFSLSTNARCQVLDHHMGAALSTTSTLKKDSTYEASASLSSFHALVDQQCKVFPVLGVSNLDNLILDVAIPANVGNCSHFCKASRPLEVLSDCVNSCAGGNRRISAHASFSKEKLSNILSESPDLQVNLEANLVFYDLSEAIISSNGPDLQVDAASAKNSMHIDYRTFEGGNCAVFEGCVSGPGERKLLKFDGVIKNLGDQDFILGEPESRPDLFYYSSCHGHNHLKEAMSYELLHKETLLPVTVNDQVVVGHKQGFCMLDMRKLSGDSGPAKYSCRNQGLTSGWADVYSSGLDCQWIDVTDVPSGEYFVRITVNPGGTLNEANKSNNSVIVPYTIP